MIKFCPNCKGDLKTKKKGMKIQLAQGCMYCNNCEGVFYQLECTKPKK